MTTQRQLKVGEEVRHLLSMYLSRHAPFELQNLNVTVTEVRMSADLRHGKVYVTPLGGQNITENIKVLQEKQGLMRHYLAQNMSTKNCPRLVFYHDDSFEKAQKIEALFRQPKVLQDLT